MKNIKRIALLLLISLSWTISGISQISYPILSNDSLILITPEQLKSTNLIFAKYSKLNLENEALKCKAEAFKNLYINELRIDSIRVDSISKLNKTILQYDLSLQKQTNINSRQKTYISVWRTIGISTSIALLIVCVL